MLVYLAVEGTSSFSGECNYTIDWIKLEEGDTSTAPNGLVQNATQALYAAAAKGAEELSKGVEIAVTTNIGWHKFMEASGVATSHGFSAIVLVNGELHVNSPARSNREGSGIIEVDYYNNGGSATDVGIYILAGNLAPEDFYVTASGNSVSVYKNFSSSYRKVKFTELSMGGRNATTTYVNELQETAPAGGNIAVIRNNSSYTAVSQLGLSYPCTTVQIMNALPLGSRIDVAVEAISSSSTTEPNVTDAPYTFGTLSIIRAADGVNNAYNRYVVTFVRSLSNDHSVWFGEYVADASTQTITSVEWKEIINADGTSTPMLAGGVNAQQLTNEDLNSIQGDDYYGRTYWASGTNTCTNKPTGVVAFSLEVLRGAQVNVTIQICRSAMTSSQTGKPATYQRCYDNSSWSTWEEIVTSTGTYPDLTAGYAQSIPTASETVIGGAKIWKDSDGYLNIDTQ